MSKTMSKTRTLCECAVMLALSIVLSYIVIYKMPLGGGVTLLSMLPILFIGVKHGLKWGMGTSLLYAAFQLSQALGNGNVFPYCNTTFAIVVCVLFDYVLPFGILGMSGLAYTKKSGVKTTKILIIFGVLIFIRFICHAVTGIVIWGQWAPEGMGLLAYTTIYNGQYMLPELILTLIGAGLLMSIKPMRKLLCQE